MPTDVKIPPMGESITSGILANWRVNDGDTVKRNQPLFELETDKITSEGVAEADGVIRLKVEAGAEVKIGQVVAVLEPTAAAGSNLKSEISDLRSSPTTAGGGSDPKVPTEAQAAASAPAPGPSTPPPIPTAKADSQTVSPAVRRIAAETGVDPSTVSGTGKAGRVTKGDMLEAAAAPAAPQSQISDLKSQSAPPAPPPAPASEVKNSNLKCLRPERPQPIAPAAAR